MSRKPYQKRTSLDVTSARMAEALGCGVQCTHGPEDGLCGVPPGGTMPRRLCNRILDSAEVALGVSNKSDEALVSLHEACVGEVWETLPVTNTGIPEENLRRHFHKNALSGVGNDMIT